jgi:hypothetical protein
MALVWRDGREGCRAYEGMAGGGVSVLAGQALPLCRANLGGACPRWQGGFARMNGWYLLRPAQGGAGSGFSTGCS